MSISSVNSAIYRSVGLNPNLLRLDAGRTFERLIAPAMRLIQAVPQYNIYAGGRIVARADWLWQGRYVIDTKLGQYINFAQLGHFINFAASRAGSVTYLTLTRTPQPIVDEAVRLGATRGVAVSFLPLIPI
jgi:hypothetical protein